jgi:branched-chain amino acid transport system substrate-binding protein
MLKSIAVAWSCLFLTNSISYAADEVVIGVATSLTLLEGKESAMAVDLAVEEINRRGGIKVRDRLLPMRVKSVDLKDAYIDTPVSKALADLEAFIIQEQVHAVLVGPFRSEVLLAGMDMISRNRVPVLGAIAMSAATEARIMKENKYRNIFRTGLNSKYFVEYLIKTMKFLRARFGFNRVYVMNQDVAWTRAASSMLIRLYFDRAGWKVVSLDTYPSGASDFSKGLKKANSGGAQVILAIFDMPQSGILVRQWNQMKTPAILCGFISPMVGSNAWEEFDGKIDGALNVVFELGNVPAPKFKPADDFYRKYRSRYGRDIQAGHGPAPAYESVHVFADAVERAGSLHPENLIPALEKTDRIGAMGRLRFHKGHQVIFGEDPHEEALACVIQWTKQGKRKIVFPASIAEGEIELPGHAE